MPNKKLTMSSIIIIAVIIALSFFLSAFLKFQSGEEQSFKKAQALLKAGRYEESLEKSQEILKRYPSFAKIDATLLNIGLSQTKLENYDAALTALEKIINDYPQSRYIPDAIYYAAEIYAEKGELRKTSDYLERILRDYPKSKNSVAQAKRLRIELSAEQIFKTAETFYGGKKYQEAILEFQKLLSHYPHDLSFIGSVLFEMGYAQKQLGDDGEALATFQNLINNYPQNIHLPEALYFAAQIAIKKGNFQIAEEYVGRISKEYSDYKNIVADTQLLRQEIEAKKIILEVQALVKDNKCQEALNKSQEILNKYPNTGRMADALFAIGLCQISSKNYNEALTALGRLINDYSKSIYVPEALYLSAKTYVAQGNTKKAEEYINRILKEHPLAEDRIINDANKLLNGFKIQ